MKNQASLSSATPKPMDKKKPVRPAKKASGPMTSDPTPGPDERDEMIRQTAYFLYESRSREGGRALDDWLQAEAQISNPASVTSPRPGL